MSSPGAAYLPDVCAIGFKEWAGVCGALGTGRQSILIRKGGIAEDRGEFRPEHPAFWLIPTVTHQSEQGLKPGTPPVVVPAVSDGYLVDLMAVVESVRWIDRVQDLPRIDELHVWTDETVHKRFFYRDPGLWVLGVRVFRRDSTFHVEATPERVGCKTWISLDNAADTAGMRPVIGDAEADHRRRMLASLIPEPDDFSNE